MVNQEINQSLSESRPLNETPTLRHKSSPTHEFIGSHSSEAMSQTSQWEMTSQSVGPVVCGPPPFIYHQNPPHYYPTNAPMPGQMPGPFYSPVANGTHMGLSSNKEVNKIRSSGSHNPNKVGKGVHNPDIRPPFYPPHNQYSEVFQFIYYLLKTNE